MKQNYILVFFGQKHINLSKDSYMINVHSRFMNIEIILPCSFVKPHFGPILSSSTRNLGIFGNDVTLLCYVDCFEADKALCSWEQQMVGEGAHTSGMVFYTKLATIRA